MRRFVTSATASVGMLLALPSTAQVSYSTPIPAPQNFAASPGPGAPPFHALPNQGGNQVWQNGRWVTMPPSGGPTGRPNPNRWGGTVNGRWVGGMRAPGGWNGYRRLGRGQSLAGYWMSPDFVIDDYLAWGLASPPYGYHWVRYYDDAVLVDAEGRVWNSVGGIAWAGAAGYADDSSSQSYSHSYSSVGGGYAPPAQPYARGGYVPPVVFAPPAAQVQQLPPDYDQGYDDARGYGSSSYGSNSYGSSSYGYGSGGTSVTVVTLPAAAAVTTTTTTTTTEVVEDEMVTTYRDVRRVYRPRPRHVVHRAVCCPCRCR